MPGYFSKYWRHDCTRKGCFIEQLPDDTDIADCFPHGIRPSDGDKWVHINDHFLFFERKGRNSSFEGGQKYGYRQLSRRARITVVVYRPGPSGDESVDVDMWVWRDGETTGKQTISRDDFLKWIETWALAADENDAQSRPVP